MAITLQDANGVLWQISVDTQGNVTTQQVAAAAVVSSGLSTISLQKIVNLAATHVDLMPLAGVGGYQDEPALSLCNDVLAELLCAPLDWKFNRIEMGMLVTVPNKQDYMFAGATAFTLGSSSSGAAIALATSSAISETGNTVTVSTLEPHRFKVGDTVYMTGNTDANYNSTFTDDGSTSSWSGGWVITVVPNTRSFKFTHALSGLGVSGAPGISDFGWLASASMVELNNNSSPRNVWQLQAVRELPVLSKVANPDKVAVYKDNGDGTVQLRFSYVPGTTTWGANLVYQARSPLKTALTDTWAPFPDSFSNVYRQAFLYRAYRYLNNPRAEAEYAKMQQEIQRVMGADDREESEVHVTPTDALMDSMGYWSGGY